MIDLGTIKIATQQTKSYNTWLQTHEHAAIHQDFRNEHLMTLQRNPQEQYNPGHMTIRWEKRLQRIFTATCITATQTKSDMEIKMQWSKLSRWMGLDKEGFTWSCRVFMKSSCNELGTAWASIATTQPISSPLNSSVSIRQSTVTLI